MWRHLYRGGGWAPTYISVVSVAPATVLTFNGSAVSIAVAGALLCPVVVQPISKRLPADFHPFISNTTSMAVCTALVIAVLRLICETDLARNSLCQAARPTLSQRTAGTQQD